MLQNMLGKLKGAWCIDTCKTLIIKKNYLTRLGKYIPSSFLSVQSCLNNFCSFRYFFYTLQSQEVKVYDHQYFMEWAILELN